jgi:hypothetical protein
MIDQQFLEFLNRKAIQTVEKKTQEEKIRVVKKFKIRQIKKEKKFK